MIFTYVGPVTIIVAVTAIGAGMSEQSSISALAAIVSALLSLVLSLPFFSIAIIAVIALVPLQALTLVAAIYTTNVIVALATIYLAIKMLRLPARTGARKLPGRTTNPGRISSVK